MHVRMLFHESEEIQADDACIDMDGLTVPGILSNTSLLCMHT